MKTEKLNQKNIIDGAVKMISAAGGVMAGGALQNVIPLSKNYGNLALTAGGGTAAVLMSDKSTGGTVVKYMGLGVATRSLVEIVREQIKGSVPQKVEGEPLTTVDKLVQGAVGMACPDGASYLASPTINFDSYPEVEPARTSGGSGSSLLA